MEQLAEPKDPTNADTLPPPGVGVFKETSFKKALSNVVSEIQNMAEIPAR